MTDGTSEVRTTSSTGGEKGVKPEAHSLIPTGPLAELARVYGKGAEKYARENWRLGYEWSKSYDAAQRHLQAFWSGEDRDPEMGTFHLGNAAFHIFGLLEFLANPEKYGKFDDRYKGGGTETKKPKFASGGYVGPISLSPADRQLLGKIASVKPSPRVE